MSKNKTTKAPAPKKVSWKLHEPDQALAKILNAVKAVRGVERVQLVNTVDRILAENIKSPLTLPAHDASERDGYAIRACDGPATKTPTTLNQCGHASAGTPFKGSLKAGQCVRIATGALIPKGADAVVMFEDVKAGKNGGIRLTKSVRRWQWIARAGHDLKKGAILLRKGDALTPAKIAGASACGFQALSVLRRPKALVFTTGDEVKKPGEKLRPGDVYDGNSYALAALLRQHDIDADTCATVRDTQAALIKKLKTASSKYDLIVFTGGTSVGDKDFGRRALDECGRTIVHGVNVKPGKPLLFGTIGKCAVFGLPGFPTSSIMIAYTFLLPAALKLFGCPEVIEPWVDCVLAEPIKPDPYKRFMLPVKVDQHGEILSAFRGSAAITSISEAAGYIELEPGTKEHRAGSTASVRLM